MTTLRDRINNRKFKSTIYGVDLGVEVPEEILCGDIRYWGTCAELVRANDPWIMESIRGHDGVKFRLGTQCRRCAKVYIFNAFLATSYITELRISREVKENFSPAFQRQLSTKTCIPLALTSRHAIATRIIQHVIKKHKPTLDEALALELHNLTDEDYCKQLLFDCGDGYLLTKLLTSAVKLSNDLQSVTIPIWGDHIPRFKAGESLLRHPYHIDRMVKRLQDYVNTMGENHESISK